MGGPIGIAIWIFSAAVTYLSAESQRRKAARAEKRAKQDYLNSRVINIKANTRSTSEQLKIIYGRYKVGGNDVFMGVPSKETIWFVQTIGEGELDGIYQINGVDQVFVDTKLYTEINAEDTSKTLVEYEFYSGTNTQSLSDSTSPLMTEFIEAFPAYTDNLRNTAFIVWKFQYNDVFRGLPQRNLIINGRVLYDFRTETYAFSQNPVLALYDFLTNTLYGVSKLASELDMPSWIEAADYCDTKGFEINYVANVNESNWTDIIDNILQCFRGGFTEYDGIIYLRYRDLNEETSVMTIDDEHIIQDQNGKSSITINKPGLFEYPKLARISYIDDQKDWTEDSFLIGEENSAITEITFEAITDSYLAGVLGTYELERARLNRTISGTFRDECSKLQPYDIVTFSCTSLGVSDQEMRVVDVNINQDNYVDLTLEYEATALYDDTFQAGYDNLYLSSFPDRRTPSEIQHLTVEEELYDYRKRTLTRLLIDFDVDEDDIWYDHCEVWFSMTSISENDLRYYGDEVSDFSIDPVEEGQTYYLMLKTVNKWGVKQTYSQAQKISKNVLGKSLTRPPSPAALRAIPSDGSLALKSTDLNDPDIFTYEIRLGNQWSGGVYLASNETPNWFIKPVKPGDFGFHLNTLGTNGLYGQTPTSATCLIPLPKGWASAYNYPDDYTDSLSGQVFENVEHITYLSDDYLKCSHGTDATAGIILEGYYESEVFDVGLGNTDTFFAYIETEFATIGGGTTWVELFGDSTSVTQVWSDQNVDERTWGDIFTIEVAPQVNIQLYYKELSGDDWSYIDNCEIFAGVVYARYFKVKITIIDPAPDVNLYVKNYTLKLYN